MLPFVRLARRFSLSDESGATPPRTVSGYETGIYLTDGGEITVNGERHVLRRHDVRFLRAGDVVSSCPQYTCVSIYFDFGSMDVLHRNELLDAIAPVFPGTPEMARLFERVLSGAGVRTVGSAARVSACMLELLLSFYARLHSRETYSPAVLTCMAYMQAHLSEPVSLDTLGHLTDYSALHVLRMFRRDTQTTPHAYLTALRVARARELLEGGGLSVAQIAAECGFESESHFQSLFKRQTGMTPGQYRRRARAME